MEYIQKALELAREQRQQKIANGEIPETGEKRTTTTLQKHPASATVSKKADFQGVPETVELSQPFITTPQATFEQHRIVAGNKGSAAADKFDMLRTQIFQEMNAKGWRTLGITSPMPRCGKTTVAINLCVSMAKACRKDVVLVDLDLRNPTVANYLGIESTPDLSDILDGRISFRGPLVNSGVPRLLIIPNKKTYLNSSEALASPEAIALAQNLKAVDDFQIVVFDLPPALPTDDTLAFLPNVDCILVVLADGTTTKQELADTQQLLKHTNLLGFVLNQFK
jgi:Mrp family chromosome partitioning ATPase